MKSIRVIPVSAVLSRVPYEWLHLQKWVTPPLSRAAYAPPRVSVSGGFPRAAAVDMWYRAAPSRNTAHTRERVPPARPR